MPSIEYTQTKGLVQKSDSTDTISLQGQLFGLKNKLETIGADRALLATDSGKVFLCSDADITITLPRCTTAGITYRFILAADATNAIEISQKDVADDFEGTVLDGAGGSDSGTDTDDLIRFVSGAAVAGDFVEVVASGSRWLVSGVCRATGGIIFN